MTLAYVDARPFKLRTGLIVSALLVCLGPVPMVAARSPADDFDWQAKVRLQGTGPLHSVVVPAQAYVFSRSPNLADLRVFNAQGEQIPFAFDRVQSPASTVASRPVRGVPLRMAAPASGPSGLPAVSLAYEGGRLTLNVQGQALGAAAGNDRTVAWYFDLGAPTPAPSASGSPAVATPATVIPAYRALTLHLGERTDYQTTVTLEGSDDLRQWRTLARDAPLLQIGRGPEAIRHDRIEFPPARERYLRLAWPAALSDLAVAEAVVEDEPAAGSPQWQSHRLTGKARLEAGQTVARYDAAARLPVDRVQLILRQLNTIAPAVIESRSSESDPWMTRLSATFYRLAAGPPGTPDAVAAAQPVQPTPVDDRFWQVRFDRRAGDFSADPPDLELVWPAQRLVFAARGGPPFMLAVGRPRQTSAALPVSTLIPGYRADQPLPASTALLEPAQTRSGERGWMDDVDPAQAGMWAALVAAVAVLGGMALRLLRSPSRGE